MSNNNQATYPKIEESWKEVLKEEFEKEYFKNLVQFIKEENKNHIIYPAGRNIFAAFDNTPFPSVRVVLLGQDPYHGPGQAHGLCFSVPDGVAFPPSLRNIFKELHNDLGIPVPYSGNLTKWAKQGVFLLNATLTVRQHQAGSHQGKGWEEFTDQVIKTISDLRSGVVFLLWGNYAQKKENLIDINRHYILKAPHPSPLSASRGFFGSKHFSKTNKIFQENGLPPIDWNLNN